MQIQTLAAGRGVSRRRSLACGVAAIAVISAAGAVPAAAQDTGPEACGPIAGGQVVCAPDPAGYPEGIHYVLEPEAPLDLAVELEGVAIDAGGQGIYVANLNGSVAIRGAGATVRTRGEAAAGVTAVSNNGGVDIELESVDVEGHAAGGVAASARGGDISIRVGDVETVGDFSTGIEAINVDHDIRVEVGSVVTTGDLSTAISAVTETGNITIEAGLVDTMGALSHGVETVTGSGNTVITVDQALTNGIGSSGVMSSSIDGDIDITVGRVSTRGQESFGVFAQSESGSVRVKAGEISTLGIDSAGLVAFSILGDAAVEVDSVVTRRDFADGVFVGGGQGARALVGDVITSGTNATGVRMNTGFALPDMPVLFGDAILVASSVETRGYGSDAISVSALGNLSIDVGSVRTLGDLSNGVTSFSMIGDSRVRVGQVTTLGHESVGVIAGSEQGDTDVVVDRVTTSGDESHGFQGLVRRGDLSVLLTGGITTSGAAGHGILATVIEGHGDIVNAGTILTTGRGAMGVEASARGSLTVESNRIETRGDFARGIFLSTAQVAVRPVVVKANVIHTSGTESHGIFVRNTDDLVTIDLDDPEADKGIDITVGEVAVTGLDAHAIQVQGQGDVSIVAGNLSSAQAVAVNVITKGAVSLDLQGEMSGQAAARLVGASVSLNVRAGARVRGASDSLYLKAGDGGGPIFPFAEVETGRIAVTNAGEIIAGNGAAIVVEAGTIDLANTGRISGAVTFSNGDDRFGNAGLWTFDRDSEFGFGDDELVNSGVMRLAGADGTGGTAITANLYSLERLVNAGGLVDLRNGVAGDVLVTGGDYVGRDNAFVGLDFSASANDLFVVEGAATGRTGIILQGVEAASATLDLAADRTLVRMGEGSSPDAFHIANPEIGFVRYGVAWDADTRSYGLTARAGAATHRILKLSEIAQGAWHEGGDAWGAERSAARVQGRLARPGEVWAQAQVSGYETDGSVDLGDGAADLGYETESRGGQAGVGLLGRSAFGGEVALGLTAGYSDVEAEFSSVGQKASVQTLNVGVTGDYVRGPVFAGVLLKFDSHDIDVEDPAAGYAVGLDGHSVGARLQVGARFAGALVFEPSATLDYVATRLDDLAALDQTVGFEDLESLQAAIGGRVYGGRTLGEGHRLTFSAGLRAVHAAGGDQAVELRSGTARERIVMDGDRTWGEAGAGVVWATPSGLSVYATGTGAFGEERTGGGVRVGARFAF